LEYDWALAKYYRENEDKRPIIGVFIKHLEQIYKGKSPGNTDYLALFEKRALKPRPEWTPPPPPKYGVAIAIEHADLSAWRDTWADKMPWLKGGW
jgi:hypothetical protein